MRARDIMTTAVHTVAQDASVADAAGLLAAKAVTALPVVDAAGSLVGMVSEGDLLAHRVPEDPTAHLWRHLADAGAPAPATVGAVMSARPITTTPEADVSDVAELMLRHDVRSVPVVVGRRVVGIISRRDILRAAVRDDDVLTREVQGRLDEYAGTAGRWTVTVTDGVASVAGPCADDTDRTVVGVLARTVPGVTAVHLAESVPR
jgi:CBS domain-containing protein